MRSPPGLAKTPLSALGLKPHNPAEILLHPVGGECRHGGCGCFLGGVSVRIPLEESPGWRRHFCLIFGPGSLGILVTYCGDSGSVWGWGMLVLPRRLSPAGSLVVEAGKLRGPASSPAPSPSLPSFFPPFSSAAQPERICSPACQLETVSRALSVSESGPWVQRPCYPESMSQSSLPSQTLLLPNI